MPDDPRTFVERAAAAIASPRPRDVVPTGIHAPAPQPGFRFAVGARVLDLVNGAPGRVTAAYPGAASNLRVYELRHDAGAQVVRLEQELESWLG